MTIAVLATLSVGCGTTQIVASEPWAVITIDGVPAGRGHATVQKTGFPGTAHVSARTDDGRVAHLPLRREFGWTAGLLGFITYGVCFIACWQYPDTLYVTLPPLAQPGGAPPWGGAPRPMQDPWLVPPPSWSAPARPDTVAPAANAPVTPTPTAPPPPPDWPAAPQPVAPPRPPAR